MVQRDVCQEDYEVPYIKTVFMARLFWGSRWELMSWWDF